MNTSIPKKFEFILPSRRCTLPACVPVTCRTPEWMDEKCISTTLLIGVQHEEKCLRISFQSNAFVLPRKGDLLVVAGTKEVPAMHGQALAIRPGVYEIWPMNTPAAIDLTFFSDKTVEDFIMDDEGYHRMMQRSIPYELPIAKMTGDWITSRTMPPVGDPQRLKFLMEGGLIQGFMTSNLGDFLSAGPFRQHVGKPFPECNRAFYRSSFSEVAARTRILR